MSLAPCLYQESRLNLDPAYPGSTVDVQITSDSSFAARLTPKRRRIDRAPRRYDEDSFTRYDLASHSSIHFRPKHRHGNKERSPRAVLWRVLNERRLLELQAVDLYQDKEEKHEPLLTLRLSFPEPIRPACIAFAEEEHEANGHALIVLVLTKDAELHTICLKREHFVKPDLLQNKQDWRKTFSAGSVKHRQPFKLVAKTADELWVSCGDGSIVKLENKGLTWRDTVYTEGGWISGSVRGLINWKATKTIRYEDADLHAGTATSMAFSPTGKHLWAVGLDHTVRALNLAKGSIDVRFDLGGNLSRNLQADSEILLQPTLSQRIQLLPGKHHNEYFVVTFSPIARAFKIWLATENEDGTLDWTDARPDTDFLPPSELGASTNWNLECFHMEPPKGKTHEWRAWIVVCSGPRAQTYTTCFKLDDQIHSLEQSWQNNWASTEESLVSSQALEKSIQNPTNVEADTPLHGASSIAEHWLSFLFHPGRFSSATLETALSVYEKGLGTSTKGTASQAATSRSQSLQARISGKVGSTVVLGPLNDEVSALERHGRLGAAQWHIFYGIVKDLHSRRGELLSMAVDPEEHLPWLIRADTLGPVRACADAEIMWHNQSTLLGCRDDHADNVLVQALGAPEQGSAEKLQLSQLCFALETFRNCLSESFVYSFVSAIGFEVLEHINGSGKDRLQALYDRVGFLDRVSDEDYDRVTDALEPLGGFLNLDTPLLLGLLEFLEESQQGKHHVKHAQVLSRYGARTLMTGSQETLQLSNMVVIDLLLLITFIGGELEEGDLSDQLDVAKTFDTLVTRHKKLTLLTWLASSPPRRASSKADKQEQSGDKPYASQDLAEQTSQTTSNLSLLGDFTIGDWSSMKFPTESQQSLITYWTRAWTFALPLESKWDDTVTRLFGELILSGDLALAREMLPFVPETPWAMYLTGRLYLLLSQLEEAVTYLDTAAKGLAVGKQVVPEQLPAGELLDQDDRECFSSGYGAYYYHISTVFAHANVQGHVVNFAKKALYAHKQEQSKDMKLKTELSSLLFAAALKTSQFALAFETLSNYSDLALRDNALRTWMQALLAVNNLDTLVNADYSTHNLSTIADTILTELATKSSTHNPSVPTYKILYAFRFRQGDLRGAASSLWQRLQDLRHSQSAGFRGGDVDQEVAECYLALINCLSLVTPEQAWLLYRPRAANEGEKTKRRIITLDDVRRAWQEELDRVADVAAGRFAIGGLGWGGSGGSGLVPGAFGADGDGMEVDVAS